jgi:hypothetical protein
MEESLESSEERCFSWSFPHCPPSCCNNDRALVRQPCLFGLRHLDLCSSHQDAVDGPLDCMFESALHTRSEAITADQHRSTSINTDQLMFVGVARALLDNRLANASRTKPLPIPRTEAERMSVVTRTSSAFVAHT